MVQKSAVRIAPSLLIISIGSEVIYEQFLIMKGEKV